MELTLDAAVATWDSLAERLERFSGAWEASAAPPKLESFLVEFDSHFRRVLLIELIKLDMEYRRRHAAPILRLEDYVERHPELIEKGRLPSDLIYEEYHVCRTHGEAIQPKDYLDRFPKQADELRRLFQLDTPTVSVSLFGRGRSPAQLKAGDTINDFELILLVGKGAFGSVFLARQKSLQRLVALKVTADEGTEPQALAQLEHPYIVQVYDQKIIPERGVRLLYMQYVVGGTLEDVILQLREHRRKQRTGRLLLDVIDEHLRRTGQAAPAASALRNRIRDTPWAELVCQLGIQLAEALAYAHEQGLLHRDVKPANVLITAEGTPKLADFNVSFSSKLEGATPAAFFGGSLAYMSPEQLECFNPSHPRQPHELDRRCDVYSLAVLLWELLLGERPFGREVVSGDWTETLARIARQRRDWAQAKVPTAEGDDVESRLRQVLRHCLAVESEAGINSAHELARQLRWCLLRDVGHLIHAPRPVWQKLVGRAPILAVLVVALIPHIVAAAFNYAYNQGEIVGRFPELGPSFERCALIINGTLFPAGVGIAIWLIWPVHACLASHRIPAFRRKAAVPQARRRALAVGQIAVNVALAEWLIAGAAFPLGMHLLSGRLEAVIYLHFLVSMLLSGLIVAAYPFFLITFLTVRVFYPGLLRLDSAAEPDLPALNSLIRRSGFYLFVAGCVPLVGVSILSLVPTRSGTALSIVSLGGVAGFAFAFWLYRMNSQHLSTLVSTISAAPADYPLATGLSTWK